MRYLQIKNCPILLVITRFFYAVPPAPPSLFIQESSKDALNLKWTLRPHHSHVRGFIINYKRDFGDWEEVSFF